MAKDDVAADPATNVRLLQFRKLFNDYTNNGAKKPSTQRSTNSPATSSPSSTPEKRSSTSRRPLPRKKSNGGDRDSSTASSPSAVSPEKDGVAEAKELAKADDEEFENVGAKADNLLKCTMKTRDLQWKSGAEDKKVSEVSVSPSSKSPGASGKSMDEGNDRGVRRKKQSVTPKKQRSRTRNTGGTSSPGGSPNPSAEMVDSEDSTPEKGVRGRAKRSANKPESRTTSPSGEAINETDALPEINQESNEFKLGIKLMGIFKKNNLLENALFPAQNEVIKTFFEGGMRNPDQKILGLISKAMDFVLDAVFFRGEDLDCMLDNDLKWFIADRPKIKPLLLDLIIFRPEYLPQSWGGRTVLNPDPKDKK